MKVLITGAGGFVGKNLQQHLAERKDVEVVCFTRANTVAELPRLLEGVEFVFHLAGVNRPQDPQEFVTGNADLTAALVQAVEGEMRARGRGHILLVSSISAFRDFPSISYYGSSKKYLRGFARCLRSELAVYGVNVTCLTPGATATALYDPSVVPVDLAKRLGVMMDPDAVARAGLAALFDRRAECIPGPLNRVLAHTAAVLPQGLIDLARRYAPWLPPVKTAPR